MKIPFDIKFRPQIESGEYKVETRDGRRVRIICWDRINKRYPIIALVPCDGDEISYDYTNNGHYYPDSEKSEDDLFIITPEPELSEFESKLLDWLSSDTCGEIPMDEMKKCVKNRAEELLELARKEIMDGWSRGLHDTQDISGKAYIDGHLLGFEQGKADALKCLPRWEKCSGYMISNYGSGPCLIFNGNSKYLMIDGYQIKLDELFKLPGFKED